MQKELLEIEFRYHDRPIGSCPATSCSKTIAIGIFDTLEEAVKAGNETLKVLSEHFQVRSDDRFKVRGLFGTPDRLVTNCCYTTKGIAYFADTENIDVNKKTMNNMDVIVLNHKNKVSLQVQHVDIGSSIDLHFPNENQSFDAFQKLREIGVRCFHAGKNAPCGASVMMYSYGNDSLQLQIK